MSDASDEHAARMQGLNERGWNCEHPTARVTIGGTDDVLRKCVTCDGLLYGVPRSCFLSVECGRVMLIGEMRDVLFDEFVRMLSLTDDPELVRVGKVLGNSLTAPARKERGLFDEEV